MTVARRICEQVGEQKTGLAKLGGQGGRGKVAGDQNMVRFKTADPRDDVEQPFQAELPRSTGDEAQRPQGALAEQRADGRQSARYEYRKDGRSSRASAFLNVSRTPSHPAHQDIVEHMRSDRHAETANQENPSERDAGGPSKNEGEPGERFAGSAGVMRDRERKRRSRHGQGSRPGVGRLQELENGEQQRDQRQSEQRLLVKPRTRKPAKLAATEAWTRGDPARIGKE